MDRLQLIQFLLDAIRKEEQFREDLIEKMRQLPLTIDGVISVGKKLELSQTKSSFLVEELQKLDGHNPLM